MINSRIKSQNDLYDDNLMLKENLKRRRGKKIRLHVQLGQKVIS